MISVRRIKIGEGVLYKRMRLASLSESPEAFSTTLESADGRRPDSWYEQADSTAVGEDRITVFAFSNGKPVGIAALYREEQNRDSGELIQFWVSPEHRGEGAAKKMLEEIYFWAMQHGFEHLSAWVNQGNERAIRFYQKHGFELTDKTQPFRSGSDELSCLMVKQFGSEQTA
jgi:GNAT superfamily N-acetyltransferase